MKIYIKKVNKKEIIFLIYVILLSMTGVEIINVGSTSITPFYIAMLPITLIYLPFILLDMNIDKVYLPMWGVAITVFSLLNVNVHINSVLHFDFYILVAIILMSISEFSKKELLLIVSKTIIAINFINIIIAHLIISLRIENSFLTRIFIAYEYKGTIRYCGFTSEPSYLAMILTICIIGIVKLSYNQLLVKEKKWFIIYFITIILSKTTWGILSLIIVVIISWNEIFSKRQKTKKYIVILIMMIIFIIVGWIVLQYKIDSDYFNRIVKIVELFISSRSYNEFINQLRIIDSSAWYRVGPFIKAMSDLKMTNINTWIGNGIGSSALYYTILVNEDSIINGGFWQSAIYDFGFIGTTFITIWILKKIYVLGIWPFIYVIFCLTNCAFSTQAFWFIILMSIWISEENIKNELTK